MVIGLPAGRALVTDCALAILETLQTRAQVVTKSAPALLSLLIFPYFSACLVVFIPLCWPQSLNLPFCDLSVSPLTGSVHSNAHPERAPDGIKYVRWS